MIRNTTRNQKLGWVLFIAYMALLVYFMFFHLFSFKIHINSSSLIFLNYYCIQIIFVPKINFIIFIT